MTPDLMEEGARREARAASPHPPARPNPAAAQGGLLAHRHTGRGGHHPRPHPVPGRHHVSFDGFKAINKLSLDIAPGELRCIIGPNGAGKTTMMDIITGKTRPDSGTVFFGSTIDLLRHNEPRSPSWASAASSRSPRCSSSSACSRTWNWR
jgi:urea transport system ATP-binding protein